MEVSNRGWDPLEKETDWPVFGLFLLFSFFFFSERRRDGWVKSKMKMRGNQYSEPISRSHFYSERGRWARANTFRFTLCQRVLESSYSSEFRCAFVFTILVGECFTFVISVLLGAWDGRKSNAFRESLWFAWLKIPLLLRRRIDSPCMLNEITRVELAEKLSANVNRKFRKRKENWEPALTPAAG